MQLSWFQSSHQCWYWGRHDTSKITPFSMPNSPPPIAPILTQASVLQKKKKKSIEVLLITVANGAVSIGSHDTPSWYRC